MAAVTVPSLSPLQREAETYAWCRSIRGALGASPKDQEDQDFFIQQTQQTKLELLRAPPQIPPCFSMSGAPTDASVAAPQRNAAKLSCGGSSMADRPAAARLQGPFRKKKSLITGKGPEI